MLNVISGASGLLGALVAYGMVAVIPDIRPFVLAFSSASLLYIAMSDLIPDLHRGTLDQNSLRQVLLIAAGVATIVVFEQLVG
jgi:zinc and cadmium transporter